MLLFDDVVTADALDLVAGGTALRTRLAAALVFLSLMMMGDDQPEAEPDPVPWSRDNSAEHVQTSSQIGQRTSSLTGDHCFTDDLRFFEDGSGLVGLVAVLVGGERVGEALVLDKWWVDRGDRRAVAVELFGGVGRATGVCAPRL